MTKEDIIPKLKDYFLKREDVEMAFLFGSYAKGRAHTESDVDIAVYFVSPANGLWAEYDEEFPSEHEIWCDVERIIGAETDLVVLNKAFPTVADAALRGIPILVKRRNVFINLVVHVTSEAIDMRAWVLSFWKMKQWRKHGHTT